MAASRYEADNCVEMLYSESPVLLMEKAPKPPGEQRKMSLDLFLINAQPE